MSYSGAFAPNTPPPLHPSEKWCMVMKRILYDMCQMDRSTIHTPTADMRKVVFGSSTTFFRIMRVPQNEHNFSQKLLRLYQ